MNDYKLVYQSGHTDTFCNGETHKTTNGGWVGMNPARPGDLDKAQTYKCDCAKWAAINKRMREG